MISGNSKLIKHLNEKRVLDLIRKKKYISRSELAKLTKLNPSTITDIISRLLKQKLVIEEGTGNSTGGRKPKLITLNSKKFLYVGVSIHFHVHCILVDINGKVLSKVDVQLDDLNNFEFDSLRSSITEVTNKADINTKNLRGIGIGVPGQVDPETGMVKYAPHLKLSEFPVKNSLSQAFDLPIFVDNGMKAKALAELWFGEGKNLNNFILLNIGEGIGSAIVIDRKIYRGHTQKAGEVGHNYRRDFMDDAEDLCRCGNKGCVETVADEKAILKAAREAKKAGHKFPYPELTLSTIFDSWREGDQIANDIINKASFNLGVTIADLFNTLDPERLIISGSVIEEGGAQLLSRIIEIAKKHVFGGFDSNRVICSNLGKRGIALGAATMGMYNNFEEPLLPINIELMKSQEE